MKRIAFLLGSATLASVVASALASGGFQKTAPSNAYVDSKICASCHQDVDQTYRQTGMGRSIFQPMTSNTIEDYKTKNEYYHALSDTHYSMIIREGIFYQRRWQIGPGGVETNLEEMKIDYVLGAGDLARSYLHRTERETLIELPLGWYAERGGYWAMNPGFDSRHPQTRRMVSNECVFCHTGYPEVSARTADDVSESVFTGKLSEGIDCQRCHGPGSQHIRTVQTSGVTVDQVRASIVNPARLDPQRQLEVCMQCHLEPTSGRLLSLVRKFDRTPFSYVPGQPLGDFIRYFDFMPGTGHDDRIELVSAAYRLRKSRCFIESKEALTCLNCHNPHRALLTGEAAIQTYATACRKCHEPALDTLIASNKHTASADCVSCHMPKRRTEDVVHTVVTDHRIQRLRPEGDLLADMPERHLTEAQEYHGEVIPYYPSPLPNTSENRLYRAVAQVGLQNNLRSGVVDLSREISLHPPRQIEFYTTLGDAWQTSGKTNEAVAAFARAVQINPNSVNALQLLASATALSGDAPRSEDILKRALHIAPLNPESWYQYGLLEANLGRVAAATKKVQKALVLNPDLPGGFSDLAGLLLQAGQPSAAEAALRSALRIDPYDAPAYNLAGRMLVEKGNLPEAADNFGKAARFRPSYAPYLYDYALILVRANQFDEAEVQALAAIQVTPGYAEGHDLLGSLYARKRKFAEAAAEYQMALVIKPTFSRAHLDLGLLLVTQRNLVAAAEHLRQAASGQDANIAKQATLALQQIGAR